jgi:hypothetical protein
MLWRPPSIHELRLGQPPEGQLDGGERNQGFSEVLEVLGEAPVSSATGEGALDHPETWQDDEALDVVPPLDDVDAQRRHLCPQRPLAGRCRRRQPRSV